MKKPGISLTFWFGLGLLCLQCQAPKPTVQSLYISKKLKIDKTLVFPGSSEREFQILHAEVKGNSLRVSVSYHPSNNGDRFELLTDGMVRKSKPPELGMFLRQSGTGKTEKWTQRAEMAFDISELSRWTGEEMIIRLSGTSEKLIYKFSENKNIPPEGGMP